MFENFDFNSFNSDSTKPQIQIDGAFGISGEIDPKFNECMSGIAILAFTYQGSKDDDSISEGEIKKNISIVPNLRITAGLQKKLESVLSEMLPMMTEGADEAENKTFSERDDEKHYFVYVPRESGFGTEKVLVSENDLHSQYLSNKEQYDIVIYQLNVEIKSDKIKDGIEKREFVSIELYSNILSLLILFLKYKDDPLPFLKLYHCSWKDSADYKGQAKSSEDIIDNLKAGVSSLRKNLKPLNNFFIPSAKRNADVYVCKGEFKFCLILSKSMNQRYTLEVD